MQESSFISLLSSSATTTSLESRSPVSSASSVLDILDSTKTVLRGLWADTLSEDPEDIDEETSFFDIGGNSVLASELVSLAKKKYLGLTIQDVFEYPTLHEMATKSRPLVLQSEESVEISELSLLRRQNTSDDLIQTLCAKIAKKCFIHEDQIEDIYPCSPLQEAMIAVSQGGRDSYMTQLVYSLGDEIDLQRFKQAWETAVQSNPVLRTRIIQEPPHGMLQCVIKMSVHWAESDSLENYLKEDRKKSMLEADDLIRFALVRDVSSTQRYLAITVHHAVLDATSLTYIVDDVVKVYQGDSNPRTRPKFNAFIQQIQQIDLDAADKFWSRQVNEASSSQFPALPHKEFKALASAHLVRSFPLDWENHKFNITKSLFLRAAWGILLSLRSHNSDVSFAATLSGRSAFEGMIKDIAGPTITAVPVRHNFDDDEVTVAVFLQQIRQQAIDMMPYEHYGSLNVRRRHGDSGIRATDFQNLLLVQMDSEDIIRETLSKIGMSPVEGVGLPFEYDFALVNECTTSDDSYQVCLWYDPRILTEQSVEILAAQFHTILTQLCHVDPQIPLHSIRCFSELDRVQIQSWNQFQPSAVRQTAHTMFESQAQSSPKALALRAWDGDMTFEDLNHQSSALAAHLVSLGVGPGVLVPLCFEKSKWMTVSILAVLKAGAAWVPLDHKFPMDRLRQITKKAKATIIVSSKSMAVKMKTIVPDNVIVPETLAKSRQSTASGSITKSLAGPDDTAYVLFTSGSTGEPKGVVMSHGSLCTGIIEQGRALGCSSQWRSLQFSAHTFDPSISEGLMTLCHGGCVCVPSEESRLNDLPGVIRELDVNCAQLTPSVAQVIDPEEVPSLKTLIFVGEAANSDNVMRWADKLRLVNAYGPTETCIYCSVKSDFTPNTSPTSVGMACGGNNWIVEAENYEQLAPVGCVGEVVVSGPSLGKGYLDDEAATSAAFVTCSWLRNMQPFVTSDRIYRTGDLAFYNSDGSMQLVGRKDNQVKVRGNRVELGEVERRLNKLSPLTTVMAYVPKAGPLQRQLITILSLNDTTLSSRKHISLRVSDAMSSTGTRTLLKQLRERLSREVPDYMIPSYWVVVDDIPLNNSGKLDRKVVKQWIEAIDDAQAALITQDIFGESDTTTSHIPEQYANIYEPLRRVWSEVLEFEAHKINPHTSFFTLNGNSLSAIKVVALSKKRGLNFTVQDLLLSRTLSRLCEVVQLVDSSASSSTEFSLAPAQQYLLSLYGNSVSTMQEHRCSLIQTFVELPHTAIQKAFDKLIRVHPMLRARFFTVDGTLKYRIADPENSYRLLFTQGRAVGEEEQDAIIRTAHDNIDMANGPVFSADIFRTEAGSFIYIVTHRLVTDEQSWNTIRAHLQRFLIKKVDIQIESTFNKWNDNISGAVPKPPSRLELQAEKLDYWGLNKADHSLRQDMRYQFSMDISDLPLSAGSLDYSSVQSVLDKVSAALVYAFQQTFVDYKTPLIYLETDGRHLGANGIDFLDTVGPFSICHQVPLFSTEDLYRQTAAGEILTGIKKSHQIFIHQNGPHSTYPDIFIHYKPFAIDNRFDNFFHEVDSFPKSRQSHSGCGLIDIDIQLSSSSLTFCVYFNSNMKYQDLVFDWASKTRDVLQEARLDQSLKYFDISTPEFPLLSLDIESMNKLILEILPQLPGGASNVADVYPCSSMQIHMLEYQSRDPHLFSLRLNFEICSNTESSVDPNRLAEAWNRVVNSHSILRTLFVRIEGSSSPVQVVLRSMSNAVEICNRLDGSTPENSASTQHNRLPLLTISSLPSGAVSCELKINHALTDGWTNSLLQQDLIREYLNLDHLEPVTAYRSFIARSVAADKEADIAFWAQKLQGCSPCNLKCLTPDPVFDNPSSIPVFTLALPSTHREDFSSFCNKHEVTTATVIDLAWALTLELLTNRSDVLFGHIVSGQARSIPELYTTAGPTLNMLANRIDLSLKSIPEMAHELQAFRLEGLSHDSCSPFEITQRLGTPTLFNTAVNISLDQQPPQESDLYVKHISLEDPWDVSLKFLHMTADLLLPL
jgi:amino acid adenylation domain-containing protein